MRHQTLLATSLSFLLLAVCLELSFSSQAADEPARQNTDSGQQVVSISDRANNLSAKKSVNLFSFKWSHWSERMFGAPFQRRGWWQRDSVDFPPLGDSLAQIVKSHRKAARPMRLLIYHYDFLHQSAVLNEMGQRQLVSIAKRMDKADQPVILQPSENADLDIARRQAILKALNELDVRDAGKRVLIKAIYYPRLMGVEGEQVNERRRQEQPFTGDKTGGNPN